jgi:hypothetical protein
MQILANALPGFRDLRAPLIAGYMWLFFTWLIVEPDLDRQASGLVGSAVDLADRAGPIWTAVAIGIAAYLVGSLSLAVSRFIRQLVLESEPEVFFYRFGSQVEEGVQATAERGRALLRQAEHSRGVSSKDLSILYQQLNGRSREALHEAHRELDLPATLLVGEQNELFAEVDRLRAEGELRMAVLPPLIGLGILLGFEGSAWWLLLLPAAAVLFFQGLQRDFDSKKIIADAMRIGRVPASSSVKFSQWVEEALPKEIQRRLDALTPTRE